VKETKVDVVILGAGIVGIGLAYLLAKRGRVVGIIELGSQDASEMKDPRPEIMFPERSNEGAVKARRQVLTGNSRFWGGGLIRNEPMHLREMFHGGSDSHFLSRMRMAYQLVENEFKASPSERVKGLADDIDYAISEIIVLSGRRRSLADFLLPPLLANSKVHFNCNAEVTRIVCSEKGQIGSIEYFTKEAGSARFISERFVLAMGVIDSNLFVQRHLMPIFSRSEQPAGSGLHDHWSVSIAKFVWKNSKRRDWIFPIGFRGPNITGRRVELGAVCPWGTYYGFLHAQAPYAEIEPYAGIKSLMDGRQQGKSIAQLIVDGAAVVRYAPDLVRIGIERYVKKRLFVRDGVELELVLDFESFPHPHNRIEHHGDKACLYWDIRDEDVVAFGEMLKQAKPLIEGWSQELGLRFELLVNRFDIPSLQDYLTQHATDAFHLGGGLAFGEINGVWSWGRGVQSPGKGNLVVMSTAAFRRSGIANPVETLLAMCEVYVSSLS
jgi:hypothetical protein